MARLILFVIVVVVAVLIWVVKAAAGAVTGSEKLKQETVRSQTQKTMHTAARGVNWLNEQWEQAKQATRQATPTESPFLALVIVVPQHDPAALPQAKLFLTEYGSKINVMARIDSTPHDSTRSNLARMCIDITGWAEDVIGTASQELRDCVMQLEHFGRPAFAVRQQQGRNELIAQNGLCA